MQLFRIRYLILLGSILSGCATAYKDLQVAEGPTDCARKFVPSYEKNWFTASVDVQGHHLSGLLLIKKMPDDTDRVVFTNELGFTFFDFEFSDGESKVIQIIDILDIKAIISTLKQDFELLLLKGWQKELLRKYSTAHEICYTYPWDGKVNYVITNDKCNLIQLERGSKKKKLVQVKFEGDQQNPDRIMIQHLNFKMQITLTKIER